MELADILAERAVLCCASVKTKRQLFEELATRAAEISGHEAADILASITSREELGSTGLGNGIAIPHGKLAGLKDVVALFARLDSPIEFDSVDDQPVDLVVMLLARLLRTDAVTDQLRQTDDPAQLRAILTAPFEANYAA
jgi:PTS system nitrogen regulatory IIA component